MNRAAVDHAETQRLFRDFNFHPSLQSTPRLIPAGLSSMIS
jgi:hypothetical protein